MMGFGPRALAVASHLIVGTGTVLASAQDAAKTFDDPAPPKVNELAEVEPPEAKEYEGLTVHAAPKPLAEGAVVEEWPSFLGPRRDGRTTERPLLKSWPEGGPTLLWEMERGYGYSCPVVEGDRLVYTHRVGGELVVDCLEPETGLRYWRFSQRCDYRDRYLDDHGPRSAPEISAGRVYVHGVQDTLHCLDLETGRVVWQRDLAKEFELPGEFFGVVSSPLVVGDLLIQNIGAPGGPSVAAFDKRTGRLVWGSGDDWGASCASPVLATVHARDRLFVLAGGESRPPTGGLMVLDPKDGSVDFRYPFRSRTYESVIGASPVIAGDRVFLTAAYNTGSAGLALTADGGFEELWKSRPIGIEFSNPVFDEGYLYMVDGKYDRPGALIGVDPDTGLEVSRTDFSFDEETVYAGREQTISLSIGSGSILHADGDFLCLGDQGHLMWLDTSPKEGAKILAKAWLFGANNTWTPPVVYRGLLYVCQNRRERFGRELTRARLLCYDLRGE